ncbi:hypothetical protein EIP91_003430 [Steccherinum ochraceum]|uniref:Protein kinase domain-containing protein n=1 Tax=Steccherinum ochraceum TaxID=92696 RepID=A0A4R0RDZ3_9APHY|nr:hypothetical protein EIP91_003430 [Steccherinum ochraceum]
MLAGEAITIFLHPKDISSATTFLQIQFRKTLLLSPISNIALRFSDIADGLDARNTQGEIVMPEMRSHPWNHCAPIKAHFQDKDDPAVTFIVIPFCFDVWRLRWKNVDAIMLYIKSVIEGIAFFHAQGISHVVPYGLPVSVKCEASSLLDGVFNPVDPNSSLQYSFLDITIHDQTPFYFTHLHHCIVEKHSSYFVGEEIKVRGPEFVLGSGGSRSEPRTYTSSRTPNRIGMTLGMTDDMLYLAEGYVKIRLVYNQIALYFLEDFMEELDNLHLPPPNAETALKKWNKLHHSLTWFKRRLWPVE